MEQQTGSKIGKGVHQAIYCHPAHLTYMQSTSHKIIKIAGKNINNLRYADDPNFMAESEELKSLLMKVKKENEKVG